MSRVTEQLTTTDYVCKGVPLVTVHSAGDVSIHNGTPAWMGFSLHLSSEDARGLAERILETVPQEMRNGECPEHGGYYTITCPGCWKEGDAARAALQDAEGSSDG